MRVAAHVAALADHGIESRGGERWELDQRGEQEGPVRINAAGPQWGRRNRLPARRKHTAHGVAVHMQLAGDGANPPLLCSTQTQDLRNQIRGYGHGATLGAPGAGHGARSPGAPSRAAASRSADTARARRVWRWRSWARQRSEWWPRRAQTRAPRWCGVSMRPVEPQRPLAGNPGASRSAEDHRRRHRHPHREHGNVGASAVTVRRAQAGRAASVGIGLRSRAERPGAPCASTPGRSSDCHGRSGCTARPGRGNARTGTGALEHPCTPRPRTEAAVLDGSVPAVPH